MNIYFEYLQVDLTNTKKSKMKKVQLTNVRTLLQFSQYGEVKKVLYNGNKLMAMNAIRFAYGVRQFSCMNEYIDKNGYLPQGYHSLVN